MTVTKDMIINKPEKQLFACFEICQQIFCKIIKMYCQIPKLTKLQVSTAII